MSSKIHDKANAPENPQKKSPRGRESLAARKNRAAEIVRELARLFPVADCALHHSSAFQLLTATILSAQCTDERVNKSTPELFRRFPDAQSLAESGQEEVEEIVRPLGFFRAKATNIRGMARGLVERHEGEVPPVLEELVKLPGVGRKTASVVLGTWFGIPSGVVVDTHVTRITNLLGLVKSDNAEIIERELMQLLPREDWIMFSHRLIYHGRKTCIARRPNCVGCGLLSLCRRTGLPPLPQDAGLSAPKPPQ
jgi:endonuclease-3